MTAPNPDSTAISVTPITPTLPIHCSMLIIPVNKQYSIQHMIVHRVDDPPDGCWRINALSYTIWGRKSSFCSISQPVNSSYPHSPHIDKINYLHILNTANSCLLSKQQLITKRRKTTPKIGIQRILEIKSIVLHYSEHESTPLGVYVGEQKIKTAIIKICLR